MSEIFSSSQNAEIQHPKNNGPQKPKTYESKVKNTLPKQKIIDSRDPHLIELAENAKLKDEFKNLKKEIFSTDPRIIKTLSLVKEYENSENRSNLKTEIISKLNDFRYEGYSLGDIIMGIDIKSRGTNVLISNVQGNSNYMVKIKDGSDLSKLIQVYLSFVANKSVQFENYKTTSKGFDGKLQRFSKQAIQDFQSEWINKRATYENWIGNIRDQNFRTVKNTDMRQNNDVIRSITDPNGNLRGLKLLYGPLSKEIELSSYNEFAKFNMENGELGFSIQGVIRQYPFAFSFVRGDKTDGRDSNVTDNISNEIKIDESTGPNSKTMDQIITTSNVINQMIKEFIKTRKATKNNPFYVGLDGALWFSDVGLDTKVVQINTMNKLIHNYGSIRNNSNNGSKQEIANYLNGLYTLEHPDPQPSFNTKESNDRIVNIK